MAFGALFARRKQSVVILAEQQALLLEELMREDWSSFRTRAAGTDIFYAANTALGVSAGANLTPANGVLHLIPLISPRRSRLAEFGVFRQGGVLAQNCRFGIYRAISPDNLYPGRLLLDSGVVSVAPAPVFSTRLPDLVLEEGVLYWLGFVRQEDLGSFTLQAVAANSDIFAFERIRPVAADPVANIGLTQSGIGGALPNPFPAGATRVTGGVVSTLFLVRLARV